MIIAIVSLAVILFLFLFLIFPSLRRHPDRKMLGGMYIAHRGLHNEEYPENSIGAFENAIKNNIAIEMDVHITADDGLVVFHDNNLKRMCALDLVPEKETLETLTNIKLLDTEYKIPSFEEFLKCVDGRVPILIELKTEGSATCTRLCQKASEALSDYRGKYFIQSFYPPAIAWFKKHRRDVMRGQLSSWDLGKKGFLYRMSSCLLLNFLGRPDFISYEIKYQNNFFRKFAVFLGAKSFGWTYRSLEQVEKYNKKFPTKIFEGFMPKK